MGDPELGVRAVKGDAHDPVTDREALDVRADTEDRAGVLISDDVGNGDEWSAQAIERVAPFDTDDLDTDEHLTGTGDGVGHVFVTKDTRGTVLVIDRRFHRAPHSG
jgi:hypothetical protein